MLRSGNVSHPQTVEVGEKVSLRKGGAGSQDPPNLGRGSV